jgi:hypothetical protein
VSGFRLRRGYGGQVSRTDKAGVSRCLAFAITVLLGTGALGFQQSSDAKPGSLIGGELTRPQRSLDPVQLTPEQLRELATQRHWSFGPYDEAQFGFRTATITLEETVDQCDLDGYSIRIFVEREGARGRDRWVLSEACDKDDYGWSASSLDEATAVNATSDPRLPLLSVAFRSHVTGRTSLDDAQNLVLDLRPASPVLIAQLSAVDVDGFCLAPRYHSDTSCTWDSRRQDFLCTETYDKESHVTLRRHSWMSTGERVSRLPDASGPSTLNEFVDALLSDRRGVGTWAEPADVGAVRFIRELPSRRSNRRIYLFGSFSEFGPPFWIAVRDGERTQVTSVKTFFAAGLELREAAFTDSGLPLDSYRRTGEPPTFRLRALAGTVEGPRLFRLVQEGDTRSVYHLAIDEHGEAVVANAIEIASSGVADVFDGFGACGDSFDAFARPTRIRLAPLVIEYDIEPSFEVPREADFQLQRNADTCIVASRATWQPGTGFAIAPTTTACPTDRFRTVFVRPDGTLQTRVRPRHWPSIGTTEGVNAPAR